MQECLFTHTVNFRTLESKQEAQLMLTNPHVAMLYIYYHAELLCVFDFQNGDRWPSWICYDVRADHPRLVFDGPNICVYILRDIAISIFGPFGLKLPMHEHFGGVLGI